MKIETFNRWHLFAWIPAILAGLYFQSRYPPLLILIFAIIAMLSVIFSQSDVGLTKPQILFAGFGIVVSMAMPLFFSKMPILSFSWSFYLLAGASALL